MQALLATIPFGGIVLYDRIRVHGFRRIEDFRDSCVETLDMGAVAGIISGLVTAKIHNKYIIKYSFP